MKKDTVVSIQQPTTARDALTEVLREGAQRLLAEAVQAEVESFIEEFQELHDGQGRQRVVRNGYLPERVIQTGLGGIKVRVPRSRDRNPGKKSGEVIRFRIELVAAVSAAQQERRGAATTALPERYLHRGFQGGIECTPGARSNRAFSQDDQSLQTEVEIGKSYSRSMIFRPSIGCI